jgi:hypothetical protein
MLFTGVTPTSGDLAGAASEIFDAEQFETSLSKKPFVLLRRYEEIESNRTADGKLLNKTPAR